MHLIVAISGLHGSGKSTYARALAESYGLRYVSAGQLFRKIAEDKALTLEQLTEEAKKNPEIDRLIDEVTKEEATKGNVVLDGQLSAWMNRDKADIKIFFTAPDYVRYERIARRDKTSLAAAKRETLLREAVQKERFMRLYNIDPSDLSIYDVIFDTNLQSIEANIKILKEIISEYLAEKERSEN